MDNEFPKDGSRGSGTEPCYSVEARFIAKEPKLVGEIIYHKEWQRVPFNGAQAGIPNDVSDAVRNMGFLSYQASQSLRWWFHASLGHEGICFETRIVKHVISHSYSEKVVGAFDYIGGESRNAIMPDFSGDKKVTV